MDKDIKTKSDQVYEGQQDNVVYTCGGCGKDVYFKPNQDDVMCTECGYRILYKKRARAVMQYEAR